MGKSLSDLTLAELWELFPIYLTEHDPAWETWYEEEKERLLGFLKDPDIIINHIGSTAIPHIWAKPTVDILVELPMSLSMEPVKNILTQNDYICMSETEKDGSKPSSLPKDRFPRKILGRGYPIGGFAKRVFHLHLRYQGDNDELYFRDYMNENPHLAKQYEALKLSLWKQYEHDKDGYTAALWEDIAAIDFEK